MQHMINGAHLAAAVATNTAITVVVTVAAVRWLERRLRLEMDERVAAIITDGRQVHESAPGGVREALRENFEIGLELGRQLPAEEHGDGSEQRER